MSTVPMKQEDHDSHNMSDATEQYAGDVLPMPGEKSMGSGQDSRAVDYALGKKTSPGVSSIGNSTLGSWARRQQSK